MNHGESTETLAGKAPGIRRHTGALGLLIKLALCWLYAVWPILVVIATVVAVGVVAYRIWRRKRDSGW